MSGNTLGLVKFVRWPAQRHLRVQYRKEEVPCLLVVEAGAQPPICSDPREDWVRAPISREDLEIRVTALTNRVRKDQTPMLDSTGVIRLGSRSTTISRVQAELLDLLIDRFERVVDRQDLERRLARQVTRPTRNSLDLHIMRLRRRISSVGLVISTAWGHGYVLKPESDDSPAG